MKVTELFNPSEGGEQFAIYYDYTGAGRGPEVIAGPFPTRDAAILYGTRNKMPLLGDNYFVDVYHDKYDHE